MSKTDAVVLEPRIQRLLAQSVLIAALATIPVIVIEQTSVSAPWKTVGEVLNWCTWLVFVAESLAMAVLNKGRRSWARGHVIEIALVILTPPIFPAGLQSLRAVRILRLLRLIRVPKLMRGLFSPTGLQFASFLALLTVVGGGAAFEAAERSKQSVSFGDGLWWALSTITTVGYGDISPKTGLGRVIGAVVMIVGIGFIALLTGALAQRFVQNDTAQVDDKLGDLTSLDAEIAVELGELRKQLNRVEILLSKRPPVSIEPIQTS
ncbi:MAG TPA: potassium channel family protein [Gaiellaceae bacterium]|nr:potassium channel family protein [Gaiellaceae bacterium]